MGVQGETSRRPETGGGVFVPRERQVCVCPGGGQRATTTLEVTACPSTERRMK
jgi:hypothetical protein